MSDIEKNDMNSQIAKQERKLRKQQEMKRKMIEQQQHKQFLSNQKKLEENDISLKKFAFEVNTTKQQIVDVDSIRADIEKEINREIVKKERMLEETDKLREQSRKDEISLTIKQTRKESETQIYHYTRVLENVNTKLQELHAIIRKLGVHVGQLSRSSNKINIRNSISNAVTLHRQCDNMITTMIEDERKRVKYID